MALPRAVAIANAARADLIDRLGGARVLVGEPARAAVGIAAGAAEGPIAVVRPGSADQVVTILRVGRARHFPVTPRGHLPALEPESLRGQIILDTRGLGAPPSIDIGRRVVTVGAGVKLGIIDRSARRARLCLRGLPAFDEGATIGALLALGEEGELGAGDGALAADVVGATVVGGNGRIARIGGPLLLGRTPWPCAGLPDPLGLLVGGEGRMAVFIEVTLRLHPSPWSAWSRAAVGPEREALLAVMSAARRVTSARLADTVLMQADGAVAVRAVSRRNEKDLAAVRGAVGKVFGRHGVELGRWQADDRRVRLGQRAGRWPGDGGARRPGLDLRMSWPDAANVGDVLRALAEPQPEAPGTAWRWAFGADTVRLRIDLEGPSRRHPVILGARHLLDAGALPIGVRGPLRKLVRRRMSPGTRVLTTVLGRAFDADAVLGADTGVL